MRYDMDRVVIERPRVHGWLKYRNLRVRVSIHDDLDSLEDLPKTESYRKPYVLAQEPKEFSDLLGPLRGFLLSRIGRKWDDVYSEVRSRLNPNSTTQIHIIGHLFQFIHTKTVMGEDNKVYSLEARRYWGGFHKIDEGELYVHPVSGLICQMPERKRNRNAVYSRAVKKLQDIFGTDWRHVTGGGNYFYSSGAVDAAKDHIRVGFEQELHRVDGIWYWAVWSDVPPPYSKEWFDQINDEKRYRLVYHTVSDYFTGVSKSQGRYRSGKRQANSRDLRRHGLRNK